MAPMREDPVRSEEITKDVRNRIQEQITYFGGALSERHAIAWGGYLAGLWEKGLLVYADYCELVDMLPEVSAPDPIADIFIFEPAIADGTRLIIFEPTVVDKS